MENIIETQTQADIQTEINTENVSSLKDFSIDEIRELRESIELLDEESHNEIFKIIKKNNILFSENKNGVFVNLTEIDNSIINEIKKYVEYIKTQENELINIENKKKVYEETYFLKQ